MKKSFYFSLLVLSATIAISAQSHLNLTFKQPPDPLPTRLLLQEDLSYLGSFRLPSGQIGLSSFEYGGPIGFNPARGSLFVVGNQQDQMIAEVGIPELRSVATIREYATAPVLQTFADPFEGHRTEVSGGGGAQILTGGLIPCNGFLCLTAYDSYDAGGSQRTSHFIRPLDLSVRGLVRGPYQVGGIGNAGIVSGYFVPVPSEWQMTIGGPMLGGQCCLSVLSRTSLGPSISLISLEELGVVNPASSKTLLFYGLDHPLANYTVANGLFNTTTKIWGTVWPIKTRSILFIGRHGLGPYCYGEATDCGDTADTSKGPHQPPYVSQVWAYDVRDLIAVGEGSKKTWEPQPYVTWRFDLPWGHPSHQVSGSAYDSLTGHIFMSAAGFSAEGLFQLIHVFQVKLP